MFGLIMIRLMMHKMKYQNVKSLASFIIKIILHAYFKSVGEIMHLDEISKTEEFFDIWS
jgi:predicted amidophosphoribosyltransferase